MRELVGGDGARNLHLALRGCLCMNATPVVCHRSFTSWLSCLPVLVALFSDGDRGGARESEGWGCQGRPRCTRVTGTAATLASINWRGLLLRVNREFAVTDRPRLRQFARQSCRPASGTRVRNRVCSHRDVRWLAHVTLGTQQAHNEDIRTVGRRRKAPPGLAV